MPAALNKVPVLGGRGTVLEYANRPGRFYYRELVQGERRYRNILIAEARTIEEAIQLSIDAYGRLREFPDLASKRKSPTQEKAKKKPAESLDNLSASKDRMTMQKAIEEFLSLEAKD
jgi:hypothetical protein